ncbi:MAG: VOC family protein [Candidatus Heimdallarchaeota archaeon]|nr:VOC family protein [Candidatus Heimdallarchaeota archaeon]
MIGNHNIVHIEIPADDINKAKDFYETIFKWEVTVNTGYDEYAFFKDAEDGIGGAFQKSEEMLTTALLYISVEDIEQMLTKIEDKGGQIISNKTEISEEHGYYALFKDTCGNSMGLWSRN